MPGTEKFPANVSGIPSSDGPQSDTKPKAEETCSTANSRA